MDGSNLVEPSMSQDLGDMGPVAVNIDCDLDALAQKMHQEVPVGDVKAMFGGRIDMKFGSRIRSCFTGKAAVDWCLRKDICSDEIDAVHLLNRMMERGLLHHCRLTKLMDYSDTAYYRFPQDHFKVLVDQTGARQSVRKRLQPNSKTLRGEAALQERWYADVPNLPGEKVRKLGRALQKLTPRDVTRGFRTHHMVFQGKEAVEVLVETGVAANATDALAIGNAFLRAGLFHHIHLRAPLRNDETLYRLSADQYDIIRHRDQDYIHGDPDESTRGGMGGMMDDSRVGNVIGGEVLETRGESALELVTSSRYWTSYRASKLYMLNLSVIKGFIDMSADWDNHVDELFPTYCECYLTRDRAGTTHSTVRSRKTLNPVWNCPVSFRDVDYLDMVGIDFKAQTQLGQDILIGSAEFHAHSVMGASEDNIVVKFDCGNKQFAECAAAIIKVEFDPAVAHVDSADGGHHDLLMRNGRLRGRGINAAVDRSGKANQQSSRRPKRGSIRRSSLSAAAEDMDPVFINVNGCAGCVLLDDVSPMQSRLGSFSSLPLGLVSSHGGSVTSVTSSSVHSLPNGSWLDAGANGAGGAGGAGRRPSHTSSEARRGSIQSDLPDIDEDTELLDQQPVDTGHEALQRGVNGNGNAAGNSSNGSNSSSRGIDGSNSSNISSHSVSDHHVSNDDYDGVDDGNIGGVAFRGRNGREFEQKRHHLHNAEHHQQVDGHHQLQQQQQQQQQEQQQGHHHNNNHLEHRFIISAAAAINRRKVAPFAGSEAGHVDAAGNTNTSSAYTISTANNNSSSVNKNNNGSDGSSGGSDGGDGKVESAAFGGPGSSRVLLLGGDGGASRPWVPERVGVGERGGTGGEGGGLGGGSEAGAGRGRESGEGRTSPGGCRASGEEGQRGAERGEGVAGRTGTDLSRGCGGLATARGGTAHSSLHPSMSARDLERGGGGVLGRGRLGGLAVAAAGEAGAGGTAERSGRGGTHPATRRLTWGATVTSTRTPARKLLRQ